MSHLPYGYKVENGSPAVDETQAKQIRDMYAAYFSGLSLMEAAKTAGLPRTHSSAKRILRNRKYLGDEFYPPIIDQDTFDRAGKEISERAEKLGRNRKQKKKIESKSYTKFSIAAIDEAFDDPIKQAEYVYGQIMKEETDGTG